jgi:PAS domain S-box-containing protein
LGDVSRHTFAAMFPQSIRSRLVLLLLVAALPAGVALVRTVRAQRAALDDAVAGSARALARQVAAMDVLEVDEARELLTGLAELPAVKVRDGAACSATLASVLSHEPQYLNLGATGADGVVFCSAVPVGAPVSLGDRRYVREVLAKGRFVVGDYQVGRITGRPSLNVGYPLVGPDGAVVGVIFAALNLAEPRKELAAASLPPGGVVTLVDHTGVVLARAPEPAADGAGVVVGSSVTARSTYATLLRADGGTLTRTDPDGVERLYAMEPVGEGLGKTYVAVSVPTRVVFASSDEALRVGLLATAALGLLAVTVAWWAGDRFVVHRLRALSGQAARLARGDLRARSALPHGQDEVGQLARAFDQLAGGLERLTRRNRQILAAAREGIVSIDLQGRVLSANPAAMTLLGLPFAAMEGRYLHDLVHGDRHDRADCPFTHSGVDAATLPQTSDVFHRANGATLPVHLVGSPVREGEVLTGMVVFFADQRGRRALEEQLRQAQKMEVVGRLAGGVAHDFNNLLTAILGYGELLREQLGPAAGHRELDEMIKGAHRAAALTRQLLAFSRRDAFAPRVLDVNALVLGMEKLLRRVIGEDVTLEADLGAELPNVKMDAGQLEQVLLNLAINARDAMPRGGLLRIRTRAVPPDGLEIAVSDTGQGIPAAVEARIFEPFFTTKAAGTGLGLAIVRDAVEGVGGEVAVESTVGVGTTFRVRLSGTAEPMVYARIAADSPSRAGNETVLLVEDDIAVRGLVRRALTGAGYDVVEAMDGADGEAVADAFLGPIHLLLSDVVMPGAKGPELAERLRLDRPALRVLYFTGYAPGGAFVGGESVLAKPFSAAQLLARVREVLDAA